MRVAQVDLSLPADAIWSALTTPEEMATWMGEVTNLTTEDGGALRMGSKIRFTTRGKQVQSRVIAFEPNRRLSLRAQQGPVQAVYTYELHGAGPVRVTHDIECRVRGLLGPLRPLIARMLRRTDGGQLDRLERHLVDR